jgi:threonine dehydrogenase-like Zn-dependent dehydrogenase
VQAVVWRGPGDVRTEDVADPVIQDPRDAIIKVTSAGLCGSDLHYYEAKDLPDGYRLGHEAIGVVLETGDALSGLRPGDRVVIPATIACGQCWACRHELTSQCDTPGAQAPIGAQAEYLRVPFADFGPVIVPDGPPDDRFICPMCSPPPGRRLSTRTSRLAEASPSSASARSVKWPPG